MQQSPSATDAAKPAISGRLTAGSKTPEEKVRFDLLRSALYHDRRQRKNARLSKLLAFINILFGSAAVAAFGASFPIVGQAFGIAIAVTGAVSIVWDPAGLSGLHSDLRRRFYALLARAEEGASVAELRAGATLIYGDEPPIHNRDNRRAHLQAGESLFGDDFAKVKVWRMWWVKDK